MVSRRIISILILTLCMSYVSAAQAGETKPLFADDAPLKITLTAPFSRLVSKAETLTDPHKATLALHGTTPESHEITLSARGKSRRRRDICTFPPLRVRFGNKESGHKPAKGSVFKGQKNLKLVTHCGKSNANQQNLLLEYAAYKLFNALTDDSLKVRLAQIEYKEAGSGKSIISRTGFFIEDMDDAAKRTNRKEIDIKDIRPQQLDPETTALSSLFHFMIGNLDWSSSQAADGNMCCHNTKLMGATKESTSGLIAVPYDFDHSGLVDADYATPPANYSVRNVKTRIYKGYCLHNAQIQKQADIFKNRKAALISVFDTIPGLNTRKKSQAGKYLEKFFETINDPKRLESRVLKKCI